MATKTKRKRTVKPVTLVEKEKLPTIKKIEIGDVIELISVPVSPDAVTSCDGCCLYIDEKCNDKDGRDCTGVIFVKK